MRSARNTPLANSALSCRVDLGFGEEAVSIWLLLRTFAAGCTAITGVEAVSNGTSAFREPRVQRAHRTRLGRSARSSACCLLALPAWCGATRSAPWIRHRRAIRAFYPSSPAPPSATGYSTTQRSSVRSVSCVCRQTPASWISRACAASFAQDDFLPRSFAVVGRRLVFSVGILYLAFAAGLLLIVFDGITDRLIPLFAIGAFLTFTMSQLGMVAHWYGELRSAATERDRHKHRASLAINAAGAAATGVALVIIIVAKFTEGAWITLLAIPLVILLLAMTKRYYAELDAQLRDAGRLDLRRVEAPMVVVVTEGWNRLTDKALQFALRISPDVVAVHLMALGGPDVEEQRRLLRQQWLQDVEKPATETGLRAPPLVLLEAPYRRIEGPLLQLIADVERKHPRARSEVNEIAIFSRLLSPRVADK